MAAVASVVAVVVVLAVVHHNSEAFGWAICFLRFVKEVAFLPKEDTRAKGLCEWISFEVPTFNVEAGAPAFPLTFLVGLKLLDAVRAPSGTVCKWWIG